MFSLWCLCSLVWLMTVTFIQMGMPWQTPLFLHHLVTLLCVGLIWFQKKLNIFFKKPVPADLRKCENIVMWWNPTLTPFFLQGDDVVWEALKQCWWPDAATSSWKATLPCVLCRCYMVDHRLDHHCREPPAMPQLLHCLLPDGTNLEVKSNIRARKPLFLVVPQLSHGGELLPAHWGFMAEQSISQTLEHLLVALLGGCSS